MSDPAEKLLPCPGVELGPAFVRRLERLVLKVEAARERRDGSGSARIAGGGEEFAGFRSYRPGEDLRQLDWSLYARLDQPYVRVTRREASEAWTILLDTSASMGCGPPGKLQCAAEHAAALASVGLRRGARVSLLASDGRTLALRTVRDLPLLYRWLREARARGGVGLGGALQQGGPRESGRIFVLGDLLDVRPRELLETLRGRRGAGVDVSLAQVLAPLEVSPETGQMVDWTCPESGERVRVAVDEGSIARYGQLLEEALEAWASAAARHAARYVLLRSDVEFEEGVREVLGE